MAENHKTVLIIEDSPTQALHMQALLEQEGLKAVWAHDGREGLRMAKQFHPDLIALDIEMPEMNGFQVYMRLKRARDTANIPVIMLTQHDEHELAMLGMQMGVIDYIPKDASTDVVLLETLRQMGFIAKS